MRERSVFDVWSDRIFLRALAEMARAAMPCAGSFGSRIVTGYPVAEMLWRAVVDVVGNSIRDPKNWGPPIRFRRTPQMLRQAARVTRALRRVKPRLVWL
jgi:hypothetical protein